MALLLLIVVGACLVASLLPFLFPGAVVGLLGVALNAWLADLLAGTLAGLGGTLGMRPGALVVGPPGQAHLTAPGVLAVYVPVLALLLFVLWGRGR